MLSKAANGSSDAADVDMLPVPTGAKGSLLLDADPPIGAPPKGSAEEPLPMNDDENVLDIPPIPIDPKDPFVVAAVDEPKKSLLAGALTGADEPKEANGSTCCADDGALLVLAENGSG